MCCFNIAVGSESRFTKNEILLENNATIIENDYVITIAPVLFMNTLSDQHREFERLDIEKKNPYLALFIAVVPGSVIHGLGHAYIEDSRTFKILFITELVSIPVAYFSAAMAYGDAMSEGNQFPLAEPVGLIAVVAFFGTWIYDIVAAPLKARSLIIKKSSAFRFSQNINYMRKTVSLNIAYHFKF